MAENIGPLNEHMPPYGEFTFDNRPMVHHMDVIELPQGGKRSVCLEHLQDGRAGEMMGDFVKGFCHYPEEDEEQMVRTAIMCSGPSLFKACRLRILQATREGEVIEEMKFEG